MRIKKLISSLGLSELTSIQNSELTVFQALYIRINTKWLLYRGDHIIREPYSESPLYTCIHVCTCRSGLLSLFVASPQLHDGMRPTTLQELEKFKATPKEVELEGE